MIEELAGKALEDLETMDAPETLRDARTLEKTKERLREIEQKASELRREMDDKL